MEWNSQFPLTPPVLTTNQRHANGEKDHVCFPVFYCVHGFLVFSFPIGRGFSGPECRIYHVAKFRAESQDD